MYRLKALREVDDSIQIIVVANDYWTLPNVADLVAQCIDVGDVH